MKSYLVNVTHPTGRRETVARPATSIPQLREALESEGFSDIEFVEDEVLATLRSQWPAELQPSSQSEYQFHAQVYTGSSAKLVWLVALRRLALPLVLFGAVAAYGFWSGHWVWGMVATAFLVVWCMLVYRQCLRATAYEQLMAAIARGERAHAVELLDAMAEKQYVRELAQLEEDLVFRKAALIAAEGSYEAALEMVEPLRDGVYGEGGLFEARSAEIHYAAGYYPAFLEQMEQAFVLSQDGVLQRLDLAFAHARVGDCERARALLAEIDRRNLTALHVPVAMAVEGICSRRDGDANAALPVLAEALQKLDAFAANPVIWPLHGVLVGNYVAALLQVGRVVEARQALAPWADIVRAQLDAETLRQIETEITG